MMLWPRPLRIIAIKNNQLYMIEERIKEQLEKIRPQLQLDGGNVEFVAFEESTGVLKLKLQGACVGCPMSQMTLQQGIGQLIKDNIPEVKEIAAV